MPSTKSEKTLAHSWQFEALGTVWEVASVFALTDEQRRTISEVIENFDVTYSRFRHDSVIQKMAQQAGTYQLPESATVLFSFYDDLFKLTNGKVTPLIGDTLVSAGYDTTYSLQTTKVIRPVLSYPDVVQRQGTRLLLKQPAVIDIGAAGKGYLVDVVTELLKGFGHDVFVVDGSGDMRVVGDHTEQVGLENPHNIEEVIGVMPVINQALCASAVNRRAWGDWHHIIDPATARPTRDIIATWVLADSAMIADGLATALFFTSPQVLAKQYTYEYMRIHADGGVEYSEDFAKGVFS